MNRLLFCNVNVFPVCRFSGRATTIAPHTAKCSASSEKPTSGLKVGVATALFRRRSAPAQMEVLLVKRGKEPNMGLWALPGGRVNDYETLFAAALRELEEETGISNVSVLPNPVDSTVISVGRNPVWKLHVFVGYQTDIKEPVAMDDAADAGFYRIEDMEAMSTVEGLHEKITRAERVLAAEGDTQPDSVETPENLR